MRHRPVFVICGFDDGVADAGVDEGTCGGAALVLSRQPQKRPGVIHVDDLVGVVIGAEAIDEVDILVLGESEGGGGSVVVTVVVTRSLHPNHPGFKQVVVV